MESKQEYIERLNKALRFIESNYAENILLDDIAFAASFSAYHFHRIFSAMLNETPIEYLRRIRLEKAANLLQLHPDYPVTQVVYETGFSSTSVFSRAFLERFGMTAREFRKKKEILNQIESPLIKELDLTQYQNLDPKEIRQIPGFQLAYVRSMNGYGPSIEKAWNKVLSWAYTNRIISKNTYMLGIPLDDPEVTPKNRCRYFAALSVDKEIKIPAPIESMTLKTGTYAVFDFKGKSSGISSFYKYLYGTWLPNSGYVPDDRPTLEEYKINSKIETDSMTNEKIFNYSVLIPICPI